MKILESRKRGGKKLDSKEDLSPALLVELDELYWNVHRHNHYARSGARWLSDLGAAADLPQAELLQWVEWEYQGRSLRAFSEGKHLKARIADDIASAIEKNEAEYFEILAKILRARRTGKPVASLTRAQLKMARRPAGEDIPEHVSVKGRKPTAHDLSRAVPLAVEIVLFRRSPTCASANPRHPAITRASITRAELKQEIQLQQKQAGLENATPLREEDLSRWIRRMGIRKFMARKCD